MNKNGFFVHPEYRIGMVDSINDYLCFFKISLYEIDFVQTDSYISSHFVFFLHKG